MNNKDIMIQFINKIHGMGILTDFIKYIFDYESLFDYNYMFRMIDGDNHVIIDIYDNVSDNKFNRYIYDFIGNSDEIITYVEDDVFVKKISVKNLIDNDDMVIKLGYLFKLDRDLMIEYASLFMDIKFVEILDYIIKK